MSLRGRAKPRHGSGMSTAHGEDGTCPVVCAREGHVRTPRGTCPEVRARPGHGTHMSNAGRQKRTCPTGNRPGTGHPEGISGTRLDRVLTGYIESSLALSLGGC